ncbi:MAG: acyl-CoA/acyl-ACP dehydrogenase [Rhizobiaceae bacterium]|nr:acyl-CoA/acyl-ACP dehydrogenase [Rhizobiaceae bacterium]
MDFRFTDEQQMMADAVRSLLGDHCQPADLRRLMENGEPRDQARWQQIVELGLQGVLVPEESGGLGLGEADFILVAEACGYAGLPEPLVENAGVALPLLAGVARDPRAERLLESALEGAITVAVKHPQNPFIADADTAGAILTVSGGELYLCEPNDIELERQESIDPFRRLYSLADRPCPVAAIANVSDVAGDLGRALNRGALFASAQLLGIAQRAVDLAVAYAKERSQFGKPIGSYQAIKHLLAEAQVRIEFARPVVYAAAGGFDSTDIHSRARISHAKIAASMAADLACRTAVQVHGAMGYSWEVDVHFFLKRALALATWWGDERFHRERVAERVLSQPLGAEHAFAREANNA